MSWFRKGRDEGEEGRPFVQGRRLRASRCTLRPLFPFVPAAPFLPLRLNYHSGSRGLFRIPPSRFSERFPPLIFLQLIISVYSFSKYVRLYYLVSNEYPAGYFHPPEIFILAPEAVSFSLEMARPLIVNVISRSLLNSSSLFTDSNQNLIDRGSLKECRFQRIIHFSRYFLNSNNK